MPFVRSSHLPPTIARCSTSGRTCGEKSATVLRLVAVERAAFEEQDGYADLSSDPDAELAVGDYQATVRLFSNGFVGRVVVGDRGVLLTTDEMDIDAFEEVSVALRKVLSGDEQPESISVDPHPK